MQKQLEEMLLFPIIQWIRCCPLLVAVSFLSYLDGKIILMWILIALIILPHILYFIGLHYIRKSLRK